MMSRKDLLEAEAIQLRIDEAEMKLKRLRDAGGRKGIKDEYKRLKDKLDKEKEKFNLLVNRKAEHANKISDRVYSLQNKASGAAGLGVGYLATMNKREQ